MINHDNTKMEFLSPQQNKNYNNLNNYSAVMKLLYNYIDLLFMGDEEEEVEEQILKLGYHGSYSSSTNNFLEKVNPQHDFICI